MLLLALPLVAACAFFLYRYKQNCIKGTLAKAYWNILRKKVEFDTYIQTNTPPAVCVKPDFYIVHNLNTAKTETILDDGAKGTAKELLDTVKGDLNEATIVFRCAHVNGVLYYMRIQESTTIEDVESASIVEPPFIEVELEQNGVKKSIREHLCHFYTRKNVILDRRFLKWYLSRFYSEELADAYTLHIVDSAVNVLSVSSTDDFYEKFVL
jgi:hypothetical protein